MQDEILAELRDKMKKSINVLKRELSKIRTGRASTALLEDIMIECYGTEMPLKQVASISVPESRLILIQPWDKSIIGNIEKGILKSELGLTPVNDGKVIRVPIPPLSEERRKELVKLVKKVGEEIKVAIRNNRREANEMFKELKNEKEISEDDYRRALNEVQKITDEFIEKVNKLVSEKEKEIMEF
ncbi:MAG: ribosome recycling factor [Deltaproteobacteria bacterium]|nr:MAG: ribosome recycling factor [Deltaproteobacteria bacterium]